MSFLDIDKVSIGYTHKKHSKIVQSGLNLVANRGELIVVIGRNGCGKSTLIRSIASMQPVISGSIRLNGLNINDISPSERAKLVSVVLTEQRDVAPFSVKELISIGRDPYTGWLGSLSENDEDVVKKSIDFVSLNGFEDLKIDELSDGERQRVLIARALAQDTPLILLDEPTSHLDLPSRMNILLLLQRMARDEGKTVIMSTHEIEASLQISDKVWLMEKSKGVDVGVPEDLVLNGALEKVFKDDMYVFDKEFGSFVVKKDLKESIKTKVSNPNSMMARWTTKALSRKGYKISDDSRLEVEVDDDNKKWILNYGYESKEFYSIESLFEQICQIDN